MNKNLGNSRPSLRRRGYDYSRAGFYFITINAFEKENLFGSISDGRMRLNRFGKIAYDEWLRTPKIRRNVVLDEFIVMPNHIHGIVIICYKLMKRFLVAADCNQPPLDDAGADWHSQSNNLPSIIRGFKAAVTKRINRGFREEDRRPVWQRSYYDRIIRNRHELQAIRKYITMNPANWQHA